MLSQLNQVASPLNRKHRRSKLRWQPPPAQNESENGKPLGSLANLLVQCRIATRVVAENRASAQKPENAVLVKGRGALIVSFSGPGQAEAVFRSKVKFLSQGLGAVAEPAGKLLTEGLDFLAIGIAMSHNCQLIASHDING
ncbi:hypothetical protein KR51_00036400 [Rubidibacter lacunae KORDI 51-2]|uniref:Uncharacterized protein n=1 Tax=Rubidibacter lacunae KORDI 51-2 TaxID=582515 RepID=U5D598_9CHRO|nr:hypothetical protein KR51_00036400 [Rubidibacter lacunae KORDI 51-2]